jgi:hypothetical protein
MHQRKALGCDTVRAREGNNQAKRRRGSRERGIKFCPFGSQCCAHEASDSVTPHSTDFSGGDFEDCSHDAFAAVYKHVCTPEASPIKFLPDTSCLLEQIPPGQGRRVLHAGPRAVCARLSFVADREFLPSLCAPSRQHISSTFCCHALAKAVRVFSLSSVRLKCPFHRISKCP